MRTGPSAALYLFWGGGFAAVNAYLSAPTHSYPSRSPQLIFSTVQVLRIDFTGGSFQLEDNNDVVLEQERPFTLPASAGI